ncbi:MAG TPA: DUF6502 family protein [Myxococcota bacterium]|nr:DUF6502 family protein [Myxococcota bacterium]
MEETLHRGEASAPGAALDPDAREARQRTLVRAVRRVLWPLVRFLIAEQVPFPRMASLLRLLYVEVADSEFRLPDKPQSTSRIALLTGVHRREVKRLREAAGGEIIEPESVSLSARLIADWNALPQFLDDDGEPRPLTRSSRRPGPSLRELAETAGQDIRPQAILDEWLRLGVVELDDEGRVRLCRGSFVAESGFEEKADFFGRTVGTHLDAASRNVRGEGTPRFDQVVFYGNLRPESVETLRGLARDLGMRALRDWNREAAKLQEADAGAPDATVRVQFGAYATEGSVGAAGASGTERRAPR